MFRSSIKILLFFLIAILFCNCSNDIETINSLTRLNSGPVMSAKNIEMVFSDSGKIQARLYSVLLNRYAGNRNLVEFPKGFRILMYDSATRVSTTITGNYGTRDEITRVMKAKGNVVVRNEIEKKQLNTEQLTWDENRRLIFSDVRVKITTPDKVLFGSGLKANESFTWYQIPNVSATMTVDRDSI
ncbi:MAG: LPS export ABC transporter periplasmic protein LptC [Bacteroidota bacterium]